MTGFARADGHDDVLGWTWEVKSGNARGLDIRSRLPQDLDRLEPVVRVKAHERFKRGAVSAALTLTRPAGGVRLRLNPDTASELEVILGQLSARVEAEPPRLDGLLAVRGLIEAVEEENSPEARAAREEAILSSLDEALADLARARAKEGDRLAAVLSGLVDELERLVAEVGACAALQPGAIRARLEEQVAALLEASPALPQERLAHEAALLAVKADVREERDRLGAHLAAARDLLGQGGPVGRRLDFLCQELNREANTICAKSADIELTRLGLELKAVIDQLREQVQNIE
jgi:uncharacterized protein (TIGR00255 family)